jgi:hypothetical protein
MNNFCSHAVNYELPGGAAVEVSVVLVRASEIVPESVRWIWPGIIAKGKVTGLAGHPVAASLASKTIVRSP